MHLATAEVDRYGPLRDCRPTCGEGITVVAGPNESGKTLYLEALLQLLDPGVAAHMHPGPRVDGDPTGRVVLADGDERHDLSDGTALSDVSRIDASHLQNLLVVRDSDLALPDGPDYYTTLVEHLGDVHTSAIEALRAELVETGRVTATRLDLADREDDTKSVAESARDLAEDVAAYAETADADGLADAVRDRLRARRELATVEERLAAQRTARELATLAEAEDRLETYADATAAIEDRSALDRETLDDLRAWRRDLGHHRERIEEVDDALDGKRTELARHRDDAAEARERQAELADREADVERVADALDTYREVADGAGETASGRDSRLAIRRRVAVAGLIGAGIAGGAGAVADAVPALVLGACLAAVGVGAWIAHRRLAGKLAATAARERKLLQAARDAGFDVERPAEVAPALQRYREEQSGTDSRVSDLEARVEETADRVEELERARQEAASERRRLAENVRQALDDAGVDAVEDYEAALEEKGAAERRRADAAAALRSELGDPPGDSPEEQLDHWNAVVAERRAALGDPDVGPDAHDEAELERLEARRDDLSSRIDALAADLAAFQDRLDEFDRRASELGPPPFVDVDPALPARTVEGLRRLAEDLRALVAEIERNADVSRKAIGLLDEIADDEAEKVATLFDPEGPASAAFSHVTDGRYRAVDYDPDAGDLRVTASDGQTHAPHRLSRGTRDQLYFAARLSLARQLLDGEAGFLLLDDPFLAADHDRLRNGFETLAGLAADGWQIVYFTAKPAVHETMADEFDCPVRELAPLPE